MTSTINKIAGAAAVLMFAPTALADQNLVSRVTQALAADATAAHLDLDVRSDGNAIVIEGVVADDRAADAAVLAAAKVPGVDTIVNHIRIS